MRRNLFACALLFAVTASAQNNFGSYLGPGILRRGVDDIGSRGGDAVALRFYVGLNGVADTGYQSSANDALGNPVTPGTVTGVALTGGVYGVHKWKKSQLGLDYAGDVSHYIGASRFDNTNHSLTLGYAFQPTSRFAFDVRTAATEFTRPGFGNFTDGTDPAAIQAASLRDARYYGLSSGATVTYLSSARTSFTFGGGGNYQDRRALDSVQTYGYNAIGSVNHRLSARSGIGVDYAFSHDRARDDAFRSAVHTVLGRYSFQIGPSWALSFGAGVFIANIDQITAVRLSPDLAQLFGTDTLILPVQIRKIGPSGNFSITWTKKRSAFSLGGGRAVSGGASSYVTSETETAGANYRFTAARKWSAWISASGYRATGIGTQFAKYNVEQAGTGFSYELFPTIHLTASYDIRHQNVTLTGYNRNPSRATFGIMFSPGTVPLSFR